MAMCHPHLRLRFSVSAVELDCPPALGGGEPWQPPPARSSCAAPIAQKRASDAGDAARIEPAMSWLVAVVWLRMLNQALEYVAARCLGRAR